MRPLYVYRPVLNADEILAHYRAQGFQSMMTDTELHVTIVWSRAPVDESIVPPSAATLVAQGGERLVEPLGPKGAIVMKFYSPELTMRWAIFQVAGASSDYASYQPHVTITYDKPRGVDLAAVEPWAGPIVFGAEICEDLNTEWTPSKSRVSESNFAKAVVIQVPALIKSRIDGPGRRIVEVEASSETVDFDGDLIVQKALLDSADSFVAMGHLDLDHISELGARYGIRDPDSYVVGRPLEVRDMGGGRTLVVGEIMKSAQRVTRTRADDLWDDLQHRPEVKWLSSVYGYPTELVDCREGGCPTDIKRFLIKGFDWRSLAFTKTPKNTALKLAARVVMAKSFMDAIVKARDESGPLPHDMPALLKSGHCAECGVQDAPTSIGYRHHFAKCCGYPTGMAEIYAAAVMHHAAKARVLASFGIGSDAAP